MSRTVSLRIVLAEPDHEGGAQGVRFEYEGPEAEPTPWAHWTGTWSRDEHFTAATRHPVNITTGQVLREVLSVRSRNNKNTPSVIHWKVLRSDGAAQSQTGSMHDVLVMALTYLLADILP